MKVIKIIAVVLFFAIVLTPLCLLNTDKNVFSSKENRYLANFPTAKPLDEKFSAQFTNWLNDHIGLRDFMLGVRSKLLVKGAGMMSSDKVLKGKDGWYFYTLDNNLKLATGDYPLSEDLLEDIAQTQQQISDYYKALGKSYVLTLTPSKTTVYPEYLPGKYQVGESPIDTVANYLKEHTDVVVVNMKDDLLAHKHEAQVFWKTDTHWTGLGNYYAYCTLVNAMNNAGITNYQVFDNVTKVSETAYGELSNMLGTSKLLDEETTETVTYSPLWYVADDPAYKGLLTYCNNGFTPYVYKNGNVANQDKIFIYGDSMIQRGLDKLLAQNASQVIYTGWRRVEEKIDQMADSNIIIFQCGERYLNSLLNQKPIVTFKAVSDLQQLPAQRDVSMYVDFCCGEQQYDQSRICVNPTASRVQISGWAADVNEGKTLSKLYLEVGGKCFECSYGHDRHSVSQTFGDDGLLQSGFAVNLPISVFKDSSGNLYDKVTLRFISDDGSFEYNSRDFYLCYSDSSVPQSVVDVSSLSGAVTDISDISVVGGKYSFDVTVVNTGSYVWSSDMAVRLGLFTNKKDSGYRFLIEEGHQVAIGESYTFHVVDFSVSVDDDEELQLGLLREGVAYFGDRMDVSFPKSIDWTNWAVLISLTIVIIVVSIVTVVLTKKPKKDDDSLSNDETNQNNL